MSRLVGFSGVACDPIDRLLTFTGGEVLRQPSPAERASARGGEYDSYREMPTNSVRRLAGAGLISSGGVQADVLADMVAARGGPVMSGDECVAWWFSEALAGLDGRAARRRGDDEWQDLEPSEADYGELEPLEDPVPVWAVAWLARTVCGPKRQYLAELVAWRFGGAVDEPVTPSVSWGPACRVKFDQRCRSRRLAGVS